jgi:hypothetical protein
MTRLWILWVAAAAARAQAPCEGTPAYTPCEMVFDAGSGHARPYRTAELRVEFRSPRHRTFMMPAFWDGAAKLVVRFAPTEGGGWDYRISSNLPAYDGKTGGFRAADSEAPGFVRAANVHHWAWTERQRPHLWMGFALPGFAAMDEARFRQLVDARAAQGFNHLRGPLATAGGDPDPEYFRGVDARVRYMNTKGMVADLSLGGAGGELARLLPGWEERRRWVRYVVARYAAMNVTWQGVEAFEDYPDGRALLKELGGLLKEMDPYQHPRSTGARSSAAPLAEDRWMDYAAYGATANAVAAIEHQLFKLPQVGLECAREEGGAETMRRSLWNATMNGEYPTFTAAGEAPDSPGARQMKVWFDFFSDTRHWELEPYFDVDGGRAVALEDVEYVVYVEKPGPVELTVEKHGYDVEWIDPATGDVAVRRKYRGGRFTGEPPSAKHDWVLHVAREGRIESMNKSYKFESREIVLQELEQNTSKVPFEIEAPAGSLSPGRAVPFAAKITKQTRATRSMMWLWTGEVAADGQGYRVLATEQKGVLTVPPGIVRNLPGVLNLRLYGMNANGKVYVTDRVCQVVP